jgi:hypothetical protein
MSRKYKQRGYMEDSREDKPRAPQRSSDNRAPKLPEVREVFRCAICGFVMPIQLGITSDSQCPHCRADLHTCKNCLHFDTSSRFECTQSIPQRVSPKDRRNRCEFFKVRITVERETSTAPSRIKDPRQAFDRLFKS